MVSLLLNLAYIRSAVGKKFTFGPGFSRTFSEEMIKAEQAEKEEQMAAIN